MIYKNLNWTLIHYDLPSFVMKLTRTRNLFILNFSVWRLDMSSVVLTFLWVKIWKGYLKKSFTNKTFPYFVHKICHPENTEVQLLSYLEKKSWELEVVCLPSSSDWNTSRTLFIERFLIWLFPSFFFLSSVYNIPTRPPSDLNLLTIHWFYVLV